MTDLVPVASLAQEIEQCGPTRRVQVLVAAWLVSFNSPHTQRAYARDMKTWLRFCDDVQVDPLLAIRAHVDAWKNQGCGFTNGAPTSIARRLSAVSSWYSYLVWEEVLDKSPAAHIKRPEVDPYYSSTRSVDQAGAKAMIAAAGDSGPRDLTVVAVLLLSGLRESELVLADVDDVGWEDGCRTIDVVRKGGARQRLPLSEAAAAALDGHIADRTSGPLIIDRAGERVSVYQVYRIVRRIALAAKVPHADKISPHSLRHSFVTLALDSGALLHDIQDAVGHRDPKTTVRYSRARGQLKRNPTHKLTEYLSEKGEETA